MCATATNHLKALDLFVDAGIIASGDEVPEHLRLFAVQADRVLEHVHELIASGEMTAEAGTRFQRLLVDACARVMCHPIVADNLYLRRFAEGVTLPQARHELQQFSVFAAHFDVAQAKLIANAPTLE